MHTVRQKSPLYIYEWLDSLPRNNLNIHSKVSYIYGRPKLVFFFFLHHNQELGPVRMSRQKLFWTKRKYYILGIDKIEISTRNCVTTNFSFLLPLYSPQRLSPLLRTSIPGAHKQKMKRSQSQLTIEFEFWTWLSSDLAYVQTCTTLQQVPIWNELTTLNACGQSR